LKITPEEHFINWQQDPFGNYQARVVFPEKTKELSVEVEVIARMEVINPFDFFVEEYAEKFPFRYDDILAKELVPYLKHVNQPLLTDFLREVDLKLILIRSIFWYTPIKKFMGIWTTILEWNLVCRLAKTH
jgi:transglutaminase-like putative cysteine protease